MTLLVSQAKLGSRQVTMITKILPHYCVSMKERSKWARHSKSNAYMPRVQHKQRGCWMGISPSTEYVSLDPKVARHHHIGLLLTKKYLTYMYGRQGG